MRSQTLHRIRARNRRRTGVFAVACVAVLGAIAVLPLTAHSDSVDDEAAPPSGEVIPEFVLDSGVPAVLDLPGAPAADAEATLRLSARWAWRPTDIAVCAGPTLTEACRSDVVMTAPEQETAETTFTLSLPADADGQITLFSASASVRVTITVEGYAETGSGPPAEVPDVGVPEGTELTVHEGDLVITTPGAVIDAMDVRGLVKVKADGVTIRNSVIRGRAIQDNFALITNDLGAYSFTLEDSELRPTEHSPWINGITGANFTVRRTEIAEVVDQVHITGSDVVVEDSWLHDNLYYEEDPNTGGEVHSDNIQIQGGSNFVIQGNWIEGATNAAIMSTQDRAPISDVTVAGNHIDGGACSVNIAMNRHQDQPTTGFDLSDNVFGLGQRLERCAVIAPETITVGNENNRFIDGETVRITRGA
jgi:hypothetical protein